MPAHLQSDDAPLVDLFLGIYRRTLQEAVARAGSRCEITGEPVTAATAVYVDGPCSPLLVLGNVWDGWREVVEARTGRPDLVADGRDLFPLL